MGLTDAVVRAVEERTPFVDPVVDAGVVGEDLVFVAVRDRAPGPSGPEAAAGVAHRPPGTPPEVPAGADALAVGRWLLDPPGSAGYPGPGGSDRDRPAGDSTGSGADGSDHGDPDTDGSEHGDPDTDGSEHADPDADGSDHGDTGADGSGPAGPIPSAGDPDQAGSDGGDRAAASGPAPLPGRAVGAATLNALSAPAVDWRAGDPFERLTSGVETVATVGLFGPALRKFGATTVRVVELAPVDPDPPPGVTVESHVADRATGVPADVEGVLDGVDVLFLTGSSLIYGGVDRYLAAADPDSTVVLVGATASFVPDPAFAAGVDVVAGARVTDPAGVRRAAEAGDCATDLHGEGVEKVFVTAADGPDRPGSE